MCDESENDCSSELYEKQSESSHQSFIPENVKYFLVGFSRAIRESKIEEIRVMYETTFWHISDFHFDKIPWPEELEVAAQVCADKEFLILYKELYFRHVNSRVPGGPKLADHVESFSNFCDFFNLIIGDKATNIELPEIWLWELADEFLHQFQNYSQYRESIASDDPQELQYICHNHSNTWSIFCVLNVLYSMVDISNIQEHIAANNDRCNPNKQLLGNFGKRTLYKKLGYFSLVSLVRIQTQLCDYNEAVKFLEGIEFSKRMRCSDVLACHISSSYYLGFAYMMLQRYADAISTFSDILLYIQRPDAANVSNPFAYQANQIGKQIEQMYHLLAICLVMHSQKIADSIQRVMRERNYHADMYKMQEGDLDIFETYFNFACPCFLPACLPIDAASKRDDVYDIQKLQMQVFLDEVRQKTELHSIRSYFQFHVTVPVQRLGELLKYKSSKGSICQLRNRLIRFKHHLLNMMWSNNANSFAGVSQGDFEMDFYIDNDMIYVTRKKIVYDNIDMFLHFTNSFNNLAQRLNNIRIE